MAMYLAAPVRRRYRSLGPVALLVLSGALAAASGAGALFWPVEFTSLAGITLGDAGVVSEIRSSGGLLLTCGLFMLVAASRSALADAGLALSAIVNLAYGVSRLYGIGVDGWPAETLVQATTLEWVIGALSLYCLLSRRPFDSASAN